MMKTTELLTEFTLGLLLHLDIPKHLNFYLPNQLFKLVGFFYRLCNLRNGGHAINGVD